MNELKTVQLMSPEGKLITGVYGMVPCVTPVSGFTVLPGNDCDIDIIPTDDGDRMLYEEHRYETDLGDFQMVDEEGNIWPAHKCHIAGEPHKKLPRGASRAECILRWANAKTRDSIMATLPGCLVTIELRNHNAAAHCPANVATFDVTTTLAIDVKPGTPEEELRVLMLRKLREWAKGLVHVTRA